MTNDDIIRMAREAGFHWHYVEGKVEELERFAALVAAAEREKVAAWMMQHSYATGHGDTTEDLLAELDWQIAENWNRAMIKGIETEREACAKVCKQHADVYKNLPVSSDAAWAACIDLIDAIRARGQG